MCPGVMLMEPFSCRYDPVPEGHATIAQRFNVGLGVRWCGASPEGTAEVSIRAVNRPFGTDASCGAGRFPKVETLGYFQESLRDKKQNPDDIGSSTCGAKVAECRHNPVPEGHATIAQRFNVGLGVRWSGASPDGTAEVSIRAVNRPFGTDASCGAGRFPKVETLGYFQESLRDTNQNPHGICSSFGPSPKVETLGYFQKSLRDKNQTSLYA